MAVDHPLLIPHLDQADGHQGLCISCTFRADHDKCVWTLVRDCFLRAHLTSSLVSRFPCPHSCGEGNDDDRDDDDGDDDRGYDGGDDDDD